MDLPRSFTIRESGHRIHNPFTSEKLAVLGQALNLAPGTEMLDLACGSGEMLCTWARDHGITGTGVDISTVFLAGARARAVELDVADQVVFTHGDASQPRRRRAGRHRGLRRRDLDRRRRAPAPWTCSGAACAPAA